MSASIPNRSQSVTRGEKWFVKLPDSKKVQELTVKELTVRTVLFENTLHFGVSGIPERYALTDVVWIARADDVTCASVTVPC